MMMRFGSINDFAIFESVFRLLQFRLEPREGSKRITHMSRDRFDALFLQSVDDIGGDACIDR